MNLTSLEESKLLKSWGAPQDTKFIWFNHHQSEDSGWRLEPPEWEWLKALCEEQAPNAEYYAAYDLESLIGWLGDSVRQIMRTNMPGNAQWCATRTLNPLGDGQVSYGATPLEAVFSLAEALNQPKEGR